MSFLSLYCFSLHYFEDKLIIKKVYVYIEQL